MPNITKESMLASAENDSTYFIDFNKKCTQYGTSYVYCFVENYDLCFYPHRVEDVLGRKVSGIPCDGKKNVLEVYALIKSKPQYDKYTMRFFVDADFDNNKTVDKHIYVTTCYSIENLFLDEEVVSRILENEYKIRPNDAEGKHQKCIDLFRNELVVFHNAVMLFNSWYHAVKRKGIPADTIIRLGESIPEEWIDIKMGAIVKKYTKDIIESKFPSAPKLTDEEIEISRLFLSYDIRRLRGKYEIQFLDKYFEFLNSDTKPGHRQYTTLTKGVNINRPRMISMFEKYVSTPLDMRDYILMGERLVA